MAPRKVRAPFVINGETVTAGSRQSIELNLPHLSTYTPMSMPVHIIHGKQDGPTMFLSGAIHGDEINGVEIIRQLLKSRSINRLKGTLLAVPIVNVYGFVTHSRYLPDRRDLNRTFPGSPSGSLTGRVAHTFLNTIVAPCDYGIDLHTGANHRYNHPHIRANLSDPETRELASAFGTPVIIDANLRDGSLRQEAAEHGVKTLLYEAGEGLRFDQLAIRAGLKGVINVMREIGMLPKLKKKAVSINPQVATRSTWVRASRSGILVMTVPIGASVTAGETLAQVTDPLGQDGDLIKATATGIVIGRTNLPVVTEGDALYHIAVLDEPDAAADSVQTFHETHLEGLQSGDYSEVSEQ